MSIVTTAIFDNNALPQDRYYGDQIRAAPGLVNWIQADTSGVVLSGSKIASFVDLAGKTLTLAQGDASRQATLAAGQFAGLPGAVFDGTATRYPYVAGGWARAQAWTLVTLSKVDPSVSTFAPVIFSFDSPTVQTGIAHNGATSINMRHGSGAINVAVPSGAPVLTVLSSDTTTLRGRVNGVTQAAVATDNAVAATLPSLGALNDVNGALTLKGAISDVMIFNENLFANPALLSIVENFFVGTYGLAFDPFAG